MPPLPPVEDPSDNVSNETITPDRSLLLTTLAVVLLVAAVLSYALLTMRTAPSDASPADSSVVSETRDTVSTATSTTLPEPSGTPAEDSANSFEQQAGDDWMARIEQYPDKLVSFTQNNYEFQVIDQPLASQYGGRVFVKYDGELVDEPEGGVFYLDVRLDKAPTSTWFVTDQDVNGDGVPDLGLRNDSSKSIDFYELVASDQRFGLVRSEVEKEDASIDPNEAARVPLFGIEQYTPVTINGTTYSSTFEMYALSYDHSGFSINEQLVYTVRDDTFEIYADASESEQRHYFMRLGDEVVGMRMTGLASVALHAIPEAVAANFVYLGHGYASDGLAVYHVSVDTPLEFAEPHNYEFVDIPIATRPLLVSGSHIYHRGKYLEGLDATDLFVAPHEQFGAGYYLSDSNTLYFYTVQCHTGGYYEEGSVDDIDSWRMGC